MRAARPYESRWAHPAITRRHDWTWIAYVRKTTSADRAIQAGRGSSDTSSDRNSLQFLMIEPQPTRATPPATTTWSAHQSALRTRDVPVDRLEALRYGGGGEAAPQRHTPPRPEPARVRVPREG